MAHESKPNVIQEGSVAVTIPPHIEIPEAAGTLDADAVRRIPKTRHGIGLCAAQTAAAMRKKGVEFTVPGVNPDELDNVGRQAEDIDQVMEDLRVIQATLQQANLLIDAKCLEPLRRVYSQVQAQGKFDAGLEERFSALVEYFRRGQ